ncbi:MAG: minor capsid protein [Shewanella sp.]
MKIPLLALVRQQGIRRQAVAFRPITTTTAQANELAAIIMPIVNHWQRAAQDILNSYVLPAQDGLTVDNANDMQRAIDQAESEAERLVMTITPRLREWILKVEKWHRGKWVGSVFTATNVDLSNVLTALPVQETLDGFINRNVALVKDVSAQAQARIAETVFRNYQQRQPIAKVAKEVAEGVGMSRKRARRIASHQTANIAAALDRQRQTEAGIEQFKWRHSSKKNGRADHISRDGKVYSWSNPPDDLPGELPNCGCRAQAWLDIMGEVE